MSKFLIARRSIYDDTIKVKGYRLLFEDAEGQRNQLGVPLSLTTEAIAELFETESMQRIIGDGLIMVNFSSDMLQQDIPSSVLKQRLIIVIDGRDITLNDALKSRLQQFRHQEHWVALGGETDLASVEAIAAEIDIFRIDIGHVDDDKLKSLTQALSKHELKLMAHNIQTHAGFDQCKQLGFELFAGSFLDLPNLDSGQSVSANRLTTMRLLVALEDPDISVDTVEELISQDARLGFRLLKAVNSAAFGLPREVSSLREAVVFLGLKQIRSWASMVIISSQDEKPSDLLLRTMIRARMCELMAEYIGADDVKSYFTVGLFSNLDAILDKKMDELLNELNLNPLLHQALLEQDGDLGSMLENVIAYEHGNWDELEDSGLEMDVWRDVYMDSVRWADASFKELKS